MTLQFFGVLIGFGLGAFAVGVGIGRAGERGHYRLAAWGLLAVLVFGPALAGFVLGGAS